MIDRIPVSLQTLYADLIDRAWSGSLAELLTAGGSPYKRTIKGKDYWYLKMPMVNGVREKDKYVGPDSEEVRRRVNAHLDLKGVRKERMDMVRSLRNARLPGPDPLSGRILTALSEAGVFRLRAVVVGTAAFQTYGPILGVRFPNTAGMTSDLDLAQFHSISVLVEDQIDGGLLEVLREVDHRFEPIPSAFDSRRAQRYAIRTGSQVAFAVDLLCPLVGPDRAPITQLKALGGDAQLLRYLDFLIYEEINAVVLYGVGVPVNVPRPERYAIHKLIVAQMRIATAESQAKSRKDLVQAGALIEALIEDRPDDLERAWSEAVDRGAQWEEKLLRSARAIDPTLGGRFGALIQNAPFDHTSRRN
jgi:hypothetical protein